MQTQNIIRVFFFLLFFSIGAAVLSGSIVWDDLVRYYQNRRRLTAKEELSTELQSLNADYDALLQQVREDPNLVRRIAPATLGTEPGGEDAFYPRARAQELAAAKEALAETSESKPGSRPGVAKWITRCSEPSKRIILFLAGASLVLISFVCFGPAQEQGPKGPES